ncbi:MAG: globin family protein [Pseudolabrys sp.]
MTPDEMKLVRLSFVKVMGIKATVGRLFYDRLFTIAPAVKPMFKGDLDAQSAKLMSTLAVAIGMLDKPDLLNSTLAGLAKRHAGYGVRDEHYDKVGEALLWTLEQGLGADFTPQVGVAWASLYADVAAAMRGAAAGGRAVA